MLLRPGGVGLYDNTVREKPEWETPAEELWRALRRHPFIDPSKPVVADFFHPVIDLNPAIAADYLRMIEEPMDLTLLIRQLLGGELVGPQQFLDRACKVCFALCVFFVVFVFSCCDV